MMNDGVNYKRIAKGQWETKKQRNKFPYPMPILGEDSLSNHGEKASTPRS